MSLAAVSPHYCLWTEVWTKEGVAHGRRRSGRGRRLPGPARARSLVGRVRVGAEVVLHRGDRSRHRGRRPSRRRRRGRGGGEQAAFPLLAVTLNEGLQDFSDLLSFQWNGE